MRKHISRHNYPCGCALYAINSSSFPIRFLLLLFYFLFFYVFICFLLCTEHGGPNTCLARRKCSKVNKMWLKAIFSHIIFVQNYHVGLLHPPQVIQAFIAQETRYCGIHT